MSYKNRIIGFIDILGFGDLVFDSENDLTKFSLIEGIISKLNDAEDLYGSPESMFAHSNYSYLSDESREDMDKLYEVMKLKAEPDRVRITTFSDSIVFSCPANSDGLTNFRCFLIKLLVQTNEFRLLLRGGVSCGALVHTDQMIFGPAMNSAYFTESKVAKQPRVAIDKSFLALVEQHDQEVIASLIKQELKVDPEDSVTYFDSLALSTNKVAQNMCGAVPYEILFNERNTIEELLNSKNLDTTARSKVDWYKNYFNQYLQDNPEVEVVLSHVQGLPLETAMASVADLKLIIG